jgi:aspartate/methionine/tyrosine aminotransferase
MTAQPFVPPPYPYDRLDALAKLAAEHDGGVVDLSIGTPCDAPSSAVVAALSSSNAERGYPASIGSEPLRSAARDWMKRRFNVDVPVSRIAACVGSKEFVATTPHYLKLRRPDRDTVLYPAVSYPTYEMGAVLAGCRAVAVPMNASGGLDLASISPADAARALLLWVNSPSNPTGALDDLGAAAAWGSPGSEPARASCSTGWMASWRCTRCRSARISRECALRFMPAMPRSSTT